MDKPVGTPTTAEPTPLFDQICAALRPGPADLGHIAKAIAMTPSDAFWAVEAAVEAGRVRHWHYRQYEVVQ